MLPAQFKILPLMIQGEEYNCSSFMDPGPEWAATYGEKQALFGTYSIVFGVITEILYIPCTLGLRRDLKNSCYQIMFWLSIMDMIALIANSILFGILLIQVRKIIFLESLDSMNFAHSSTQFIY
ncbi:hypothetical protein PMAYCL1PPCAC_05261 [Pristionchus mayeri]|uniref:G protein-coupled receptor n=1 Tax=Pristionchus mayeri TaxID=1317129 RepID=A0AAN4Z9S8_9BILA|nr:hypothetical protein PMAYCL1PPCAC_05261 [Pristionchus mayeri]